MSDMMTSATVRQMIEDTKKRIRRADGSYDLLAAQRLPDLERQLETLQRVEQHDADLAARQEAERVQREKDDRAALEQRLMDEYKASLPNVSDIEARRKLPELLETYRQQALGEREAMIARRRDTLRRQFT